MLKVHSKIKLKGKKKDEDVSSELQIEWVEFVGEKKKNYWIFVEKKFI